MDIESIKKSLQSFLEKKKIRLYEVSTRVEEKENILEIVLDESFDLEELSNVSLAISQEMEKWENVDTSYLLDITCVGLERPLRNLEEVAASVSKYISLQLQNGEEIEGELLALEGKELLLRVRNKNLYKEQKVSYDEVVFARLAVKF